MSISKRAVTALILAAMLATTFSCGDTPASNPTGNSTTEIESTTEAPKDENYKYYGDKTFGGKEFTIYNVKKDL